MEFSQKVIASKQYVETRGVNNRLDIIDQMGSSNNSFSRNNRFKVLTIDQI